jgi:mannosidase alpha-like ER degradation enhancer 2
MTSHHRRFAAGAVVLTLVLGACASTPPAPRSISIGAAPGNAALAARVRAEFRHAWDGYVRHAWGHDELNPVSGKAHDWYAEPFFMTAVDALDSLILLGEAEEARRTQEYLATHLSFDKDISVQNFEITIRILGGLLSAHQMTGDPRLLALARDLGRRLLPVFDSPTGMPYRYVNLRTGKTRDAESNPAEIGTLLLEFGTLSRLTGEPVFFDKAKKGVLELYRRRSPVGLVGTKINVETGEWVGKTSHVGAMIDSYYEYLLKCDRLFGDADCRRMWEAERTAITRHLEDRTASGLWYGEADMATGRRTATRYGALHAFLPSVFALAGDLDRARGLQASGFRMWNHAGLEPEVFDYAESRIVSAGYMLRPEIIESAYYLHRYTGDPVYLEMGKTFLESLVTHCRTDAGYAALASVVTKEKRDRMPSFFLAETLKYLYLLFAPEALDFDAVVFNTEAHPFRATGKPLAPRPR